MPQLFLPVFPEGVSHITPELAVAQEKGQVTYFHGLLPVFTHAANDIQTFKMITSQFCCSGHAKQADIVRVFGVSRVGVMRWVDLYRKHGPAGFYAPRQTRGSAVLTAGVMAQAQELLDEGKEVPAVAEQLNLKPNTLHKAIRAGRLHRVKKTLHSAPPRTPTPKASVAR